MTERRQEKKKPSLKKGIRTQHCHDNHDLTAAEPAGWHLAYTHQASTRVKSGIFSWIKKGKTQDKELSHHCLNAENLWYSWFPGQVWQVAGASLSYIHVLADKVLPPLFVSWLYLFFLLRRDYWWKFCFLHFFCFNIADGPSERHECLFRTDVFLPHSMVMYSGCHLLSPGNLNEGQLKINRLDICFDLFGI